MALLSRPSRLWHLERPWRSNWREVEIIRMWTECDVLPRARTATHVAIYRPSRFPTSRFPMIQMKKISHVRDVLRHHSKVPTVISLPRRPSAGLHSTLSRGSPWLRSISRPLVREPQRRHVPTCLHMGTEELLGRQ
jgi:hypothetical protein